MKWKVRKPEARYRALRLWHVWFAWHPVRVPTRGKGSGQKMVWLAPVCRKGHRKTSYSEGIGLKWEYKERVSV
jgi:hypothetical protein